MSLAPTQWEKLRIGFAPRLAGAFVREFRAVCDNCQVRSFAVRGVGTLLDVGVSRVDSRAVVPGELAGENAHAGVWFGGGTVPGCASVRTVAVANRSLVPFPYEWDVEDDASDGVFAVTPKSGTLAPSSETTFEIRFSPCAVGSFRREAQLVIDTAFPPREPINGAAMFAQPVAAEAVTLTGEGAARDLSVSANLVNFAGALLPGRHYDREVRVTNHSDATCAFRWEGQDDARAERNESGALETVLVYPTSGELRPGETATCVVELTADDVTRCDRTLTCVCEHGPALPVRVTAEVEGPEVVVAQSAVDFGLLSAASPASDADASQRVRRCRVVAPPGGAEGHAGRGGDPVQRRGGRPRPARGGGGGVYPEAERGRGVPRRVDRRGGGGGRMSVVNCRADVLRPKVALSVTEVDLGVCHVGVGVEREVTVQNMTMLPAVFRFAPEPEGEEGDARDALDYECDWREDEIPPGGSRVVRFHFTPFKPCEAYDAVVACDVDGAAAPVAFELKCEIRGLRVAYDVLRRRRARRVRGRARRRGRGERRVRRRRRLGFRGPVRGARARDDGGGDSEPDGDGGDGIARVRVPRRAGERGGANHGGVGGRSVRGRRRVGRRRRFFARPRRAGRLPGGDGILRRRSGDGAAPGGVKTVRDAASFGSEVFGAASRGACAHLASLDPHERATKPARRKYHLPNATPSGRASPSTGASRARREARPAARRRRPPRSGRRRSPSGRVQLRTRTRG